MHDSRHLSEIDGSVLAIAVAERLAREGAERHLALARRVRDAALGAGRGVLGLADVLVALTERIVERCLRTSARITPLEATAATALADADGIAALLRW